MMLQNELNVAIISASRPKLLPYVIESSKKFLHFHGELDWILHEDFVYEEESKKVIDICKKYDIKTIETNPPNNIDNAIKTILERIKTKYVLMMQDDWEWELPIDLSHILYVMDKHPHINCIFFNKSKTIKGIHGYELKQEVYEGLNLCLYNQWPLFNAVWRSDFVRDRWCTNRENRTAESHWNKTLKTILQGEDCRVPNKDYNYLKNNVGCYIYGTVGWPRIIRHLGYTWAVKPWGGSPRRKDGYGGTIDYDLTDVAVKERAPWLPIEEDRPLYLDNKQDQVKELKNE